MSATTNTKSPRPLPVLPGLAIAAALSAGLWALIIFAVRSLR
jgi:hypothetical protein